jgi:hypothetical protein
MTRIVLLAASIAAFFAFSSAECPNACSAHGKCGPFDMCICFKNWMEADCSQRICQFNLAHVDTPKGDLDSSSGKLQMNQEVTGTKPELVVSDSFLYPYGTTEQFPDMTDSQFNRLDNTAHYYMECSNKGICDRATGTCGCFPGYEGSGCQRASCPVTSAGVCSGHGTCETISTLATVDNGNIYKLWDEHATMGCLCDGGYSGADCSERICKYGADPLYFDDYANIRYANFTYEIYSSHNGAEVYGNYSIRFTDHYGEQWETRPIAVNANCDEVTNALEALPNRAIPSRSVLCYQFTNWDLDSPGYQNNYFAGRYLVFTENNKDGINAPDFKGYSSSVPFSPGGSAEGIMNGGLAKYTLVFTGNPGYIPQFDLNFHLDGYRPTLYTTDSDASTLGYSVYANGFTGEDDDLVPDWCEGITVSITPGSGDAYDTLVVTKTKDNDVIDMPENALKRCLGDSDSDTANNVDTYNWDYGNQVPGYSEDEGYHNNTLQNPHLIKLIDATQDSHIVREDGPYKSSVDPAVQVLPITRLCPEQRNYLTYINDVPFSVLGDVADDDGPNGQYSGDYVNGWCFNKDPPGFYAVIFYDGTNFNIINNLGGARGVERPSDYKSTTKFHVFTTTGYLQKVSPIAFASPTKLYSNTLNVGYLSVGEYGSLSVDDTEGNDHGGYVADISCENNPEGSNYARDCLDKEDKIMLLHVPGSEASDDDRKAADGYSILNPVYTNLYTVKKIFRDAHVGNGNTEYDDLRREEAARHKIVLDYGTNLAYDSGFSESDLRNKQYAIYKFHPPTQDKTYNYVAQCSNRGICDTASGLCTCFPGYTGDDCSVQNALAV